MEKETAKNIIGKAKIKDSQLTVTYEEVFTSENYSNTIEKKCSQVIHKDMRDAFDKLALHLVCACEMPEAVKIREAGIYDFPVGELNNYVVTGYSHGGSDESAGVTIIGQKLLKSGKVLNLVSPFIQYEDDEAYEYAGELSVDVQGCDYEVKEYLFNEKYGIKQMSLDFDVPDDVEVSIVTPDGEAKPLRKRGRKKKEEIAHELVDAMMEDYA